jgi:hypothetical protein
MFQPVEMAVVNKIHSMKKFQANTYINKLPE